MCSLKISSEHTHTSYLVCCFCDSSITLKPSSCCCLDQGKPNFEEAGNKTITKVLHKQCVSLKQLSLSHFPFVRRIFAISWESMFLMKSAVSICKAKDINYSGFGRPKCHIFKNCKKNSML